MFSGIRKIGRRGVFNPLSRAALITWGWNYRHEILRWGRTLWNELIGRADVDAARTVRAGRVLASIAGEERLRNAPQLKQVTMNGDVVDLRVEPGWSELPRVIDRVRAVKGITGVTVNGNAVATVSARSA
jgi:hypothetical protein